jgi:hypothetical protein
MALASAPPAFAYYSSNYASTPSASAGTAFTSGANDADGTAVSCIAALGHDVHWVRVRTVTTGTSTADNNTAGDLLIDPAGGTSWTPLINDLVCGQGLSLTEPWARVYEFPLFIAAGTSIGWQAKTAHTAGIGGRIIVEVCGEPSRPETWWCGQGVETLGISDSKGTAITAGASGAAGSWTSVGSATTRHCRAVQLGVNGSDATALTAQYHFEIGHNSQRLPGSRIHFCAISSGEDGKHTTMGLINCNIPAGTQMQARATSSSAGPEDIHVAIYGVY